VNRIRPRLGRILYMLAGAAVGTLSVVPWLYLLRPYQLPPWAVYLIAGPSSLLLLWLGAELVERLGRPRRPARRRAHARPHSKTRKAA
jgi:hypothetical protein